MANRTSALAVVAAITLAACRSSGESDAGGSDAGGGSNASVVAAPTSTAGSPAETSPASGSTEPGPTSSSDGESAIGSYVYPDPPDAPEASDDNPEASAAIDRIVEAINAGALDGVALSELSEAGDARHAWFVTDLLRFFTGDSAGPLIGTFQSLTGVSVLDDPQLQISPWESATNHMIAWDTPDYPGYGDDKGGIFTQLESGWSPFFDDEDATIDWRTVSWGGVLIDDRPLGDTERCPDGCIPSLDDPGTTDAAGGAWYPDERTVFGVVVDDEALAIPLNIAEIHEMFNLTLGGERLAIPYCTLCGSAQAFLTERPDDGLVMRTSGLLNRSNKVMYDLVSQSVFDTFTGEAVSGPLLAEGVVLDEVTVVRSTWGEWRREHPDTRIIAQDGGIGRSYESDPLGGRDDDGPIFPIGDVDGRLDVQELVVGVITADGTPIAFPSDSASGALENGAIVELSGVEVRQSGDGLVAVDAATGEQIAAHEAFWFAWSQFHPDTLLWEP